MDDELSSLKVNLRILQETRLNLLAERDGLCKTICKLEQLLKRSRTKIASLKQQLKDTQRQLDSHYD